MPRCCYVPKTFSEEKMAMIANVNLIIGQYAAKGFDMTLRQIYYQFVARDLFPDDWTWSQNEPAGSAKSGVILRTGKKWYRDPNGTKNADPNYDRLGDLIGDARLAGLIDWRAVVDRTRNVVQNQSWDRPSAIVKAAMDTYAINKWAIQNHYIEVWIEKDALKGVIADICKTLDVPYFSCRGYTSLSEVWVAAQRLIEKIKEGKEVHIIHLGDHDPSGIDMSRDIQDRLEMFCSGGDGDSRVRIDLQRIALNMDQIRQYGPPPNPAKVTDSRFEAYRKKYGDESWELDALEPEVIVDLVTRAVRAHRDDAKWKEAQEREGKGRRTLEAILEHFPEVVSHLREYRSRVTCTGCGATIGKPQCQCNSGIEGAPEPKQLGGE